MNTSHLIAVFAIYGIVLTGLYIIQKATRNNNFDIAGCLAQHKDRFIFLFESKNKIIFNKPKYNLEDIEDVFYKIESNCTKFGKWEERPKCGSDIDHYVRREIMSAASFLRDTMEGNSLGCDLEDYVLKFNIEK